MTDADADATEQPLLFLDVDGPLLPFGGPEDILPWDCEPDPDPGRMRPELGEKLIRLPCRLVWATGWRDRANTELAPYIGLPQLPFIDWRQYSLAFEPEDDRLGLCWKTRAVVQWAAGRPFAWVDDEITDADLEWVAANHHAPALVHPIAEHVGLTDADFETLDAWFRAL